MKVIQVMPEFRELRMMIFSIWASMKSLVWCLLVLSMMFFIFGITITAGVVSYMESDGAGRWQEKVDPLLMQYFGTVDRSILSLYMAMSGGKDWGEYYVVLEDLPMQTRFVFLFFISFALFAVVNIVTGIFVETAMLSNQ